MPALLINGESGGRTLLPSTNEVCYLSVSGHFLHTFTLCQSVLLSIILTFHSQCLKTFQIAHQA